MRCLEFRIGVKIIKDVLESGYVASVRRREHVVDFTRGRK